MLDNDPDTLGRILMTLHRLDGILREECLPHWIQPPAAVPSRGDLETMPSGYQVDRLTDGKTASELETLKTLLSRKRLVLSDTDTAEILTEVPTRVAYRSRHVLNHALRIVRQAPAGPKALALARLATMAPDPMTLGLPSNWAADYWEEQSFAGLSEQAQTRRAMLERIVPRLAIADRCQLDERVMAVRGTRGTYRIHLGSAAVMLMPLGRHICIVPAAAKNSPVALPFAGDRTLSLILSKAILLAADHVITDPVILRQL